MRYIPSYQLNIIAEENFSTEFSVVEEKLSKIINSGSFTAFDGVNIYYEYFLAENSRGNVVIVHGLSEFTKKFYEIIYYTLNQGFNVFIYDQRCHGLSGRLTDERDLLHVDSFGDYVKDLNYFIDEIVLKTEDKPIYLFAHSMGGAITALYLAEEKDKVKKAVLSAPMFEPIVKNVPTVIAREGVRVGKLIFGKKRKFFLSEEFNPKTKFNYSYGLSEARFRKNMELRCGNEMYQSTPMSFGWVSGSLTVGPKILSRHIVGKIETPILIISAREDKMVNNIMQEKFLSRCKNCELKSIEHATHAILSSDEGILSQILKLTFDFLSEA